MANILPLAGVAALLLHPPHVSLESRWWTLVSGQLAGLVRTTAEYWYDFSLLGDSDLQ